MYVVTLTSIQPTFMWMHWATLRHHSCQLMAAVSASSQLSTILCTSSLTTAVQFVHFVDVQHDDQISPARCTELRLKRELRLIRSSWVARRRRRLLSAQYLARLLKKVLGRYQYHPIPASIGQYPIPQYWYRSNPTGYIKLHPPWLRLSSLSVAV